MSKLKWLDAYRKELADKPDMGEIEWRSLFIEQVVKKGLGYLSKLIRNEKGHTDIRINTPEGISHIVFETKKLDADLDKGPTLTQAKGYLQGGESFLVLASPHRLKVFTPKGNHLQDIPLVEKDLAGNATFWQLSHDFMAQKGHLAPFREGSFDYCYIPVHTPEGFDKFVAALQLCGDLLLRYLRKAWNEHERLYAGYEAKLADLRAKLKAVEEAPISDEERKERSEILAREEARLKAQYGVSIEVKEASFPAFQRIQPYSRDVESKELVGIYLADITYAALNRILFVRIAEDKGLLERKVSNGGIGAWRKFVTYLKDKYQDLIQLAYRDAGHIYEHFFEEGIFDWYVKGNSQLNEALESILFLLNAFDLSQVDRDTLGDLYQRYLSPRERKRLGEFYTPREVVDYILRHLGWKGDGTIIDPACGSGGFLVRAANTMLEGMKERNISEESRLKAMDKVVGLDINPFATHIAEMNLLFLILDTYLRAKEQAEKEGREFNLGRLSIHTVDSLLGTTPGPQGKGTTKSLFAALAQLGELEEAIQARNRLGEYDYLVMNPPYVRNERLPEGPRAVYRKLFSDVAAMNADIFTYFMKKAVDWLKDGGRLGVIVSLGLADAGANERLRKFLSSYTIERVVPLEWCEVFVSNVNPMLIFLKKTPPPQGHKLALVHGISSLEDLDKDKGEISSVDQARWLALAPDNSWRVEVRVEDIPVLEKMRKVSPCLNGYYGIEMGPRSGGQVLIGDDPRDMKNPFPLLDGREVKAWSIEWQGKYIDWQPELIEASKTVDFFKAPKVLARCISLTTQAAVDEGPKTSYLARNTVMVVRSPVKELNDHPYVIAALVNSLSLRYYAFLMLRSGVMEGSHRSHFYSGVIGSLPIPEATYRDVSTRNSLESLSRRAHEIAREMVNGDKELLSDVDSLVGDSLMPFAHHPQSDLSGYLAEVDLATAQVSENGRLTSSKMGIVKGHPAILEYMVARATLEGRESLSKAAIENFLVPKDMGTCVEALHQMDLWAERKPTLSQKLAEVQEKIDDLVLSTFTVLTIQERQYIKERAKQFPLNQVLVTDTPGAPTKKIAVKYWETGERYKS